MIFFESHANVWLAFQWIKAFVTQQFDLEGFDSNKAALLVCIESRVIEYSKHVHILGHFLDRGVRNQDIISKQHWKSPAMV